MSVAAANKKWLKRTGIFLLVICCLLAIAYYIIVYRVKDVLKFVVEKQSHGLYKLDAGQIALSFTKRKIILKKVTVTCTDTLNVPAHYTLHVPEIYLSITSFRDILFNKKVTVDSMAVLEPHITVHGHTPSTKDKQVSFEASRVFTMLQQLLAHLEVRKFNLHQGSFAYSHRHHPAAFKSSRINFSILNFSKKAAAGNQLFASDDIDLDITNQSWSLPDGQHQIDFKRLHFSGRNQLFELDSCVVHLKGTDEKPYLSFQADKLFFNSSRLQDIYEKEELYLDTLICQNPSLLFQPGDKKPVDTAAVVSAAAHQLFKKIHVRYIDISDGQFLMSKKNQPPSYITPKQNLQVYNLLIDPSEKEHIAVDSIQLNIQSIAFVTKDSLFQLTIEDFDLNKNDLILRNAYYGPTPKNQQHRGMEFSTPYLHIRDVSIAGLMQKKLSGSMAEIDQPYIKLTATEKRKTPDSISRKPERIELFYKNLHGLGELLAVDIFNIHRGQLHYSSPQTGFTAELKGLEASLLMKQLFQSDSMIEIKRSMPLLQVKQAVVKSPRLELNIDSYVFKGKTRQNYMDRLKLRLPGKGDITAQDLYWEIFDWDIYQKTKEVQIQALKVGNLAIQLDQHSAPAKKATRDLPVIRIGNIALAKVNLDMKPHKGAHLKMQGDNISFNQVATQQKIFTWQHLLAKLHNTSFTKPGLTASIPEISIDNNSTDIFHNVSVRIKKEEQDMNFSLPLLKTKMKLNSTDPAAFNLSSLVAEQPVIDIVVKKKKTAPATHSASPSFPLQLNMALFHIIEAKVNYRNETDSAELDTKLDLRLTGLQLHKQGEKLLQYQQSKLDITKLSYQKQKLNLLLPAAGIELDKGSLEKKATGQLLLNTAIGFHWDQLSLNLKKTDSTGINVKNSSGKLKDENFAWEKGKKFAWQKWMGQTMISNTDVDYSNAKLSAGLHGIQWNGPARFLSTADFYMTPRLSMEESFAKANWQEDYMSVKGKALGMQGLVFHHEPHDSALEIRKLLLDEVAVSTARDKRIPFKHGIEKLMPTPLLNSLRFPLRINSLLLRNSAVTVHEISIITHRQGIIPLTHLDAVITNINNRPALNDSLTINASTTVLNNRINGLLYKESYADSLSGFTLHLNASPMKLTHFSDATVPLVSVQVRKGQADTLYAHWIGNKYAAFGVMNFHYNDLAIQILDKKEPKRKKFFLSIENWLANLILRDKNKKQSLVYFERDREKFVFNYWVKTSMSGLMTSVGVKRNKKYYKKWKRFLSQYSLESWGKRE